MPREADDLAGSRDGPVLQLKARLLEVSPMVWRRLLVPAETSLRELHGILQVAVGWEGLHLFQFHLRAVHYGSSEHTEDAVDRITAETRAQSEPGLQQAA